MNVAIHMAIMFLVFAMVLVAPHVGWESARRLAWICILISVVFYLIGQRIK
ncbi:hypothetical protein [Denitromonas sp.]|uniref:hypothetical protein n=1 Tax=Denitromonas sp. TaxID=2734609 RepID=UPI003A8AA08D